MRPSTLDLRPSTCDPLLATLYLRPSTSDPRLLTLDLLLSTPYSRPLTLDPRQLPKLDFFNTCMRRRICAHVIFHFWHVLKPAETPKRNYRNETTVTTESNEITKATKTKERCIICIYTRS